MTALPFRFCIVACTIRSYFSQSLGYSVIHGQYSSSALNGVRFVWFLSLSDPFLEAAAQCDVTHRANIKPFKTASFITNKLLFDKLKCKTQLKKYQTKKKKNSFKRNNLNLKYFSLIYLHTCMTSKLWEKENHNYEIKLEIMTLKS